MTKPFKLSVLVILAVTVLLTIKDCNHKINRRNAQIRFKKEEAREAKFTDSFFNANANFFDSLNGHVNICYSHLDNIKISEYATDDDLLVDLIAFQMADRNDSVSQLNTVWPYTTGNTLSIVFKPEDVNEFDLMKLLKSWRSTVDESSYNRQNSECNFSLFPEQDSGYLQVSKKLRSIRYLALIVPDKTKSPKIGSSSYMTGAKHYKISFFDLKSHKPIETREAMAINSDIQVSSEIELFIDLNTNARKALMRTLYRL